MAVATEQGSGAVGSSPRAIHHAADWRKRLRREFLRLGVANVSLYVDGPRGIVRVRFRDQSARVSVEVNDALERLRSLPDRAGSQAAADALAAG